MDIRIAYDEEKRMQMSIGWGCNYLNQEVEENTWKVYWGVQEMSKGGEGYSRVE